MSQREPFYIFAKQLFLKGENKEIEILISIMSFISTEYILRKQIGKEKAKQALAGIRTIAEVCTSGEKEIDLSLVSSFKDFEDAFQYYSALNNSTNVIITRNPKGSKNSKIPVMSAEQYLKSIK